MSHFRIQPLGQLEPIFTCTILSVDIGYACGCTPSDRPNLPKILARILGSDSFANPSYTDSQSKHDWQENLNSLMERQSHH